jgi:hypothetical protein
VSVPPQPGHPVGGPAGGQPTPGPQGAPYGGQPPYAPPPGQPVGPVPGQPGAFGPVPGQPVGFGPAPGQPGVFGPPPGQPFGPPGPAKKSKLGIALAIVAVVVVGAAIVSGLVLGNSSPDSAQAGDCLNVKEFTEGSEPAKVDCNDPSANVKVAAKLDSDNAQCPEGHYDTYSVSGQNSYKLCLIPNDKEGDCLANFSADTTKGYQRVACGDPSAEVKLVKIAQGIADESGCDGTDATMYVTYSQPLSTYCYTELNGTST